MPTPPRFSADREPPRRALGARVEAIRRPERLVFGVPLVLSLVCLVVGGAILLDDSGDAYFRPATGLLAVGLVVALVVLRREAARWDRVGIMLAGLCLGANVAFLVLPEHLLGGTVDGLDRRSIISGFVLVLLSASTASHAVRGLRGAKPPR